MTSRLGPHRTSLPPPAAPAPSDGGRRVGRTGGEAVGVHGRADEAEAIADVGLAHRTHACRRRMGGAAARSAAAALAAIVRLVAAERTGAGAASGRHVAVSDATRWSR